MEQYKVILNFDSIELAEDFLHTIKLIQQEKSMVDIIDELSKFDFKDIDFSQFKIDIEKKL